MATILQSVIGAPANPALGEVIGIARPAPSQFQLVATSTGLPNAASVTMGAFATNQLRNGHISGRVACTRLKFADLACRITSGSGVELALAFAITALERAFEISGVSTRTLYGGLTAGSMQIADNVVLSDEVALSLPADTAFDSRGRRATATTTDTITAIDRSGPDTQGFRTNSGSSLTATGALNSSGSSGTPAYWPSLVLGIPVLPMAAVIFVGDSIANGKDDTNFSTTGGFLAEAFNSVAGHAVPWSRHTVVGNTMTNQLTAAAPKQKLLWPYATDILIQLGTNDIAGQSTGTAAARFATLQTRFSDIATTARGLTGPYGKRLRIHATTIIPRGTYDATQEATRVLYNAWLAGGASGLVDQYYDIGAVAGDFTNVAQYPNDQIHPGPAIHQAMAAVVAAGFVPWLNPYNGV